MRFSKVAKAPQVTLSEDRMTASSRKGYRMVDPLLHLRTHAYTYTLAHWLTHARLQA